MPVLLKQKYADLDEMLESLIGWNLDFLPLEKGRFPSEIGQYLFENTFVGEASFMRKVEQKGMTPTGYRTFVVPKDDQVHYHWRGYHISGDTLSLFPPDGELYSVSDGSFRVYTISFSDKLLEEAVHLIQSLTVDKNIQSEYVWKVEASRMNHIRSKVVRLLQYPTLKPDFVSRREELELLTELLLSMDNKALLANSKNSYRSRALENCIDLIMSNSIEGRVSMKQLCQASNVSERTLQYAFLERFGVTPTEYIKNYNLRMVRRALKIRSTGDKIYSIAAQYGFWHMGQFASDYRDHFGELPSQTYRQ